MGTGKRKEEGGQYEKDTVKRKEKLSTGS